MPLKITVVEELTVDIVAVSIQVSYLNIHALGNEVTYLLSCRPIVIHDVDLEFRDYRS